MRFFYYIKFKIFTIKRHILFIIKKYNANIKRKKVNIINELSLKDNQIISKDDNFEKLMMIYTLALAEVKKNILELQQKLNGKNNYDTITSISTRIKEPKSIIDKMNKKGYSLTYKDLIENINDIAGLRIVCTSEKAVYEIAKEISNIKNMNVIKKKDYIKRPKKSGYSAYHIIVEVPVIIQENQIWVKVEIQIRTLAMDFWANIEHKLKYKNLNKISHQNSSKLKMYAKILQIINKKMEKIYRNNYKYIEN